MARIINGDVNKVRYEPRPVPKLIWVLCCGATLLGTLIQAISICSPDWRISAPVTYNFMHKGTRRQHIVQSTKYGLYIVLYDNGNIRQTWADRVESVKAKGYMTIQATSQNSRGSYNNYFATECPPACREAIKTRIVSYENIFGINNLLLMVLPVTCLLALLGIVWNVLFEMNVYLIGGAWLVSGVAAIGFSYYWCTETHALWKIICGQQMIPFPYISNSYKLNLLGSVIIAASAILLFSTYLLTSMLRRGKMEESLNAQLRDQNYMEYGLPGNMAQAPLLSQQLPPMPRAPMMPSPAKNPQQVSDFSPSSLFNGVGFGQNTHLGNQNKSPNTPSTWNRNFQFN